MTKERPILFSAPMILGILNGTKTQTRRIVKGTQLGPQAAWHKFETLGWVANGLTGDIPIEHRGKMLYCPFGYAEDRLWCRETFKIIDTRVVYAASCPTTLAGKVDRAFGPWKPSIFMPRWASRITLEIINIRVERLMEISADDAIAEGIYPNPKYKHAKLYTWDGTGGNSSNPIYAYQLLWESINGEGSWERNPWVFVIEFRKL